MIKRRDALGELIDAHITAHEAEARQHRHVDFSHLDAAGLRDQINSLGSNRVFGAGQRFLLAHLERYGVDGLEAFMHRMENIIDDKQRQIVPEIDFGDEELALYRGMKVHVDRRQALKWLAGSGGAIIGLGAMGVSVGANVYAETRDEKPSGTERAVRGIVTASAVAGSAVSFSRSLEQLSRMRLAQVANAISELAVYAGPNPGQSDSSLTHLRTSAERPGLLRRLLNRDTVEEPPKRPGR